jgi:hypothetical protein
MSCPTRGPVIVKWVGQDRRFNTMYFVNEIIHGSVTNLKATGRFPDMKWYRSHPDNAQPHPSHESVEYINRHNFVRLPHLPYSRDLVPSDFYF